MCYPRLFLRVIQCVRHPETSSLCVTSTPPSVKYGDTSASTQTRLVYHVEQKFPFAGSRSLSGRALIPSTAPAPPSALPLWRDAAAGGARNPLVIRTREGCGDWSPCCVSESEMDSIRAGVDSPTVYYCYLPIVYRRQWIRKSKQKKRNNQSK